MTQHHVTMNLSLESTFSASSISPPSVLHGFATPSFLWIPLNLVPGRFQVPIESRGSGPSLTPLLCLLYLASGYCLRVRVRVSPPLAPQTKYLFTPPRRCHLPLWIRFCIQVVSVAQKGETTSRGDSLFVGCRHKARVSCARSSSTWVEERSRSRRSRMIAIAQCMLFLSLHNGCCHHLDEASQIFANLCAQHISEAKGWSF